MGVSQDRSYNCDRRCQTFSHPSSHPREEASTQGLNWKFGNGPRGIDQPGRTLPKGKGTAGKQRPQCPDSAGLCLTFTPMGQGFSFLLILHFGASVTGPFSWNRLQKSPLTSDKLTAKSGLQIKWPGDKGERGKEEGGRNTNCPLKSK